MRITPRCVFAILLPLALPLAAGDAADTIILTPRGAEISHGPLKLERKGHLPENLGFWTDLGSTVSWTLNLPAAGIYAPSLILSCANEMAGSEVALLSGTRELCRFNVPATDGFSNFRVLDLPPVSLPSGESTITIRPLRKAGVAVMDLRLITLTSVPQR